MSIYTYESPTGVKWIIRDGVIYGAVAEIARYVNNGLGGGLVEIVAQGIGVLKPNTDPTSVNEETLPGLLLAGAYFFNQYQDGGYSDISCAVYAEDIASAHPQAIYRVLQYPFGQLKVRRISAEIDLTNQRAVRQAQGMGFKLEGRKRKMGPAGDVGLFGLLPEECPIWIRGQTEYEQ